MFFWHFFDFPASGRVLLLSFLSLLLPVFSWVLWKKIVSSSNAGMSEWYLSVKL